MGGVNCDDPKLNPEGCQYIMPNQTYATEKMLKRTTEKEMRKIRAGYAGGITWTDMQIGKVLDALEATGEKANTLTLFWADHGWALGEASMFCKQANFGESPRPLLTRGTVLHCSHLFIFHVYHEFSLTQSLSFSSLSVPPSSTHPSPITTELQTRIPMLVRAPWLGAKAVGNTRAMVELIDMMPTAIELAGLLIQVDISITGPLALEGYSVAPLLEDPNLHVHSPQAWKRAAFSQYPRCMNSTAEQQAPFLATGDPCTGVTPNQVTHMGYSMRTSDWRYGEWPAWKCYGLGGDPNQCSNMSSHPGAVWSGAAQWDNLAGRELYNHTGDDGSCFDCYENENLVDRPELAAIVTELSKQLRAGWRGAAPTKQLEYQ